MTVYRTIIGGKSCAENITFNSFRIWEDIMGSMHPFTGKLIDASEKLAYDQYIIAPYPYDWDVDSNKGNIFNPAMKWYSIHDNIWDRNNWKVVAENAVMPVQD